MPRLEDRLFYRLEANLRNRDEVIEKYGPDIDLMRDYSVKNDISIQVAAALSIYRKQHNPQGEEITTDDIGSYNLIHTTDNLLSYELAHGIKSMAFHVTVSEESRNKIISKLGMPGWFGGFAFLPAFFSTFKLKPLFFDKFGMILTGGSNIYYNDFRHESLHIDRDMYSANFSKLLSYTENPEYPVGLWRAKFQAFIADEILPYICSDTGKDALAELLRGDYWQDDLESVLTMCFPELKHEKKRAKQKKLALMLAPVKAQIHEAVDASLYLKSQMPYDILTPLFFALGPNETEIRQGILYGPFADIKGWAILLNKGFVKPEKIRKQLQKKGYCR